MPFEIVQGKEKDISVLANLYAEGFQQQYVEHLPSYYRQLPTAAWAERIRKILKTEQYFIWILKDTDRDKYAGFCEYFLQRLHASFIVPQIRLIITQFYILPEYQHRGAASLLIDHIEAFARSVGAAVIEIEVPESNFPFQRFLQRKGFALRSLVFELPVGSS